MLRRTLRYSLFAFGALLATLALIVAGIAYCYLLVVVVGFGLPFPFGLLAATAIIALTFGAAFAWADR